MSALGYFSGKSVARVIAFPLVPKLRLGTHRHKTPFCVCSETNRYPSERETEFRTKRSQTEIVSPGTWLWAIWPLRIFGLYTILSTRIFLPWKAELLVEIEVFLDQV